jgi:UPF0755 protein
MVRLSGKLLLRAALLLLLGAVMAGVVGLGALQRSLEAPGQHARTVRVQVRPGEPLRSVLNGIAARGALPDARLVELWLRIHRRSALVKVGTYDIPAQASAIEVLEQLAAGRVVLESLTVVEGSTFGELRRALERHAGIRATLRGRSDAEVMVALDAAGQHPEGRFFPDTYRFAAGATDLEILRLARRRMSEELAAAWAARAADLPLRSDYEALVLASIVEKETGLAGERPLIAGVFTSRLRRGMRLQTDPTVIYGLGAAYDGNIRSRDLVTDTPYNTYTRAGLTPTPIALPGRESLRAATRPQESGALYFVATGAGDGAHVFSATYDQHRAAVALMLKRQRQSAVGPR